MTARILLLNYDYPPMGGGSGKALACLLREFGRHHPDLRIDAVVAAMGPASEATLSPGIRLHRIDIGKTGNLHYQSGAELIRFALRAGRKARELSGGSRFDLLHAFFAVPTGWIGYRMRKRLPYLVSLRGSDVPGFNPRFRAAYVALKPIVRAVCGGAAAVVANSAGLRDLAARSLPGMPIRIIPNGIDAPGSPARTPAPGPLKVLFVGRLIPRKGVDHLLKGFAAYARRAARDGSRSGQVGSAGPGTVPHAAMAAADGPELVLAGSGPEAAPLAVLARELGIERSVRFLGAVPPEGMGDLYRAADVFVLPSLEEGMSNALLEAVAHGLPVVVTDTGGTAELARGNGRIVGRGDAQGIARALAELEGDPALRGRMSAASLDIAAGFAWRAAADAYADLYRAIALRPAAGKRP
jgi:glycosyltransferase involved in cell wall biosynthesis